MTKSYDLIVIGTGPAASGSIDRCHDAGWSVAVIDSHGPGGTCSITGCVPKKTLYSRTNLLDQVRRVSGTGLDAEQARINWRELVEFKREYTSRVPERMRGSFEERGIAYHHGTAHFVSPNEVAVNDDVLRFRHAVIATGLKPRPLGIRGEELMLTSDQFMDLKELPNGIIFVGGGFISMEFAHIAARVGACNVCVYERGERILGNFEPEIVDALVEESRALGIEIRTNKPISSISREGDCCHVNSEEHRFKAGAVVHGAGRIARIAELDLAKAGVEHSEKGIVVNEFMQTTNPAIYASGDCAASDGLQLTPVAGLEGKAVSLNLLHGNLHRVNYTGTASVVFTSPPIASVGMRESDAREKNLNIEIKSGELDNWFSWKHMHQPGKFKLIVDSGDGTILGAHLFGHHADEIINLFALAVRCRLSAEDLKNTPFAFPTSGHDIRYML